MSLERHAKHRGISQQGEGASSLVVGELVQSGAGLIGAIEAVLGFDAADSGHIQQLCILLDLLLGHKNWPDVCFQVEVASTVRLRAYDGVCLVLQTCPGGQEQGSTWATMDVGKAAQGVGKAVQGVGKAVPGCGQGWTCRAYVACASCKV